MRMRLCNVISISKSLLFDGEKKSKMSIPISAQTPRQLAKLL